MSKRHNYKVEIEWVSNGSVKIEKRFVDAPTKAEAMKVVRADIRFWRQRKSNTKGKICDVTKIY